MPSLGLLVVLAICNAAGPAGRTAFSFNNCRTFGEAASPAWAGAWAMNKAVMAVAVTMASVFFIFIFSF